MKALVLGANGTLGAELIRQLQGKHEVVALGHADLDVTDQAAVMQKIQEIKPEVIFNTVAYNAVDKAEEEPEKAEGLNKLASRYVASAAESANSVLVHYSTNFVFDGQKSEPYKEDDQANPISVYGRTKYEGELEVQKNCTKHYIVRLSVLFGQPGGGENAKKTFPDLITELSLHKTLLEMVSDEVNSPSFSVDLSQASIRLVEENYPYGIYHLANSGEASWYDFAKEIFKLKHIETPLHPVSGSKFARPARRPAHASLVSTKFPPLRTWQEALKEFLN
jgi:dTDP-4-dehydrorhamnose reductase